MPRLLLVPAMLLMGGTCLAAESGPRHEPAAPSPPAQAPAVPAMVVPWEQSASYERPESRREAVRRVAQWKAEQRHQRTEAMKWIGYSPLRPPASPLPFMGSPYTWIGAGVRYPLPGMIYQPALPTYVLGRAVETVNR